MKYFYFVAFVSDGPTFGNLQVETDFEVRLMEDVALLTDVIKKLTTKTTGVVVTNYILLRTEGE